MRATYREDTLQSDLVSHESLQEVVSDFLKLLNASNVCAYDGLLFLVDSDCTEDLGIHEQSEVKVSESCGELALIFLIEDDLACGGVIIHFKDYSHLFILARDESAHDYDLVEF